MKVKNIQALFECYELIYTSSINMFVLISGTIMPKIKQIVEFYFTKQTNAIKICL